MFFFCLRSAPALDLRCALEKNKLFFIYPPALEYKQQGNNIKKTRENRHKNIQVVANYNLLLEVGRRTLA